MSVVHLEDNVRQGIARLQDAVADLIDNSQALARSAMDNAGEAFKHSREQAEDKAQEALRYSQKQAKQTYGQVEKMAGRQPMAALAVGLGIGAIVGFVLHAGAKSRPAARPAKAPAVKKTAATAPAKRTVAAKMVNGAKARPAKPAQSAAIPGERAN